MRDAINNNPVVQISVLAGLLVIVGFLMMTRVMGGDKQKPADPAVTGASATGLAVPPGTDPSVAPPPGVPATTAPAPAPGVPAPPADAVDPSALKPGPGLPAEVVNAWKGGKAVALLVYQGGGIDDKLVRGFVSRLSGSSSVAVFTVTVDKIARYSRIAQGVGVSRVPALVTIRPRKLSGASPEAVVAYGFRNPASVEQAVRDAIYSGPDNLPYHPD